MGTDTVTMIALDTLAVEDEIAEKSQLDASFAEETRKIQRCHINKALLTVSPSDGFYEMFDDLRQRVIEEATRLAETEGQTDV